MRILGLLLSLTFAFSVHAQGGASEGLDQVAETLNTANTIVGGVGGIVSEIDALFGGGSSGGGSTTTEDTGLFDPEEIFPAWGDGGRVTGVIGSNSGPLNQGEGRLIIYFIPKVIELMIWLVAPIITVMFLYAGMQFIWGGDKEEEVKKARDFFRYAVIGLTFIVLSYSLMKAAFFIMV